MRTLIFATNNINKVIEVKSILNDNFKILSLAEANINIDIAEPFDTLEKNAIEKARVINEITKENCFSEDTGLEVDALNGEPGVKSARYAGNGRDFENNIDKLLNNLKNKKNNKAHFKTVICLILDGKQNIFDGLCKGTIIAERRGHGGFGYDPVFIPEGSEKTFGEMSLVEKNFFSHRKKAFEKLISFLNSMK
ncbi:MAG: RdgB/HAM1 family non-canonical purine NTP pyrophosphatase [Bacteroidota bacterium]|nr:RdgB/HAM1 family non-canonical purine NTP pyrophosphatase [Bacteroidota bacterium]